MGAPSTFYFGMPSSPTSLKGFSNEAVQPMDAIALSITMSQGDCKVTKMIDFLVVKAPSSYNAILGHPTLNNLKIVTSTYHFKMKFPTKVGVGEVRGEQILARECYVQVIKVAASSILVVEDPSTKSPPPPLVITDQDVEARDETNLMQVEADEPLKQVTLHWNLPNDTT